tara:strand:- start:18 stop:455 length:438 start_codon:yes stop_codon:yes gene_type:complete
MRSYYHIPADIHEKTFTEMTTKAEPDYSDFMRMKESMKIRMAERLPSFNEDIPLEIFMQSMKQEVRVNFWFDEEALMFDSPQPNKRATILAHWLCNKEYAGWLAPVYFGNACIEIWGDSTDFFYSVREHLLLLMGAIEHDLLEEE